MLPGEYRKCEESNSGSGNHVPVSTSCTACTLPGCKLNFGNSVKGHLLLCMYFELLSLPKTFLRALGHTIIVKQSGIVTRLTQTSFLWPKAEFVKKSPQIHDHDSHETPAHDFQNLSMLSVTNSSNRLNSMVLDHQYCRRC